MIGTFGKHEGEKNFENDVRYAYSHCHVIVKEAHDWMTNILS